MAKIREERNYKETREEVQGKDRQWVTWKSDQHGWVAVPKSNYPHWREKVPFCSNMPPIFAHDRYDQHYDHSHRRVDRLLDEVVAEDKTINFGLKRSRSTVEDDRDLPREIYKVIKGDNKKAKK